MRNVSKNRFLLCFRPVVDIDAMLDSKVAHKHEMKKNSETKSVFFQQRSPKFSEKWTMQRPPKQTLSRVIKAVVFETILNRRARHKNRYGHDSFGSKHSYSTCKETKDPQSPLSSLSSHGSASSCSSPHASESKSLTNYNSTKEQQQKENSHGGPLEKQKKFEYYGIYMVLISLAFTVFWGTLFGIILTSIWLYFFSLWSSSYGCKKRLPSCPRQRQSLQAKDRGHYGRSAPRELYHNGH